MCPARALGDKEVRPCQLHITDSPACSLIGTLERGTPAAILPALSIRRQACTPFSGGLRLLMSYFLFLSVQCCYSKQKTGQILHTVEFNEIQ